MNFNKIVFYPLFLLIFSKTNSFAQNQHEIGMVNDNDLYVSLYLDQFYTSGLELFYRKVASTRNHIFNKKIKHFSLCQNIYNPQLSDIPEVFMQERPYAGILHLNYTEQIIYNKNILSLGVTASVTNHKSGAEMGQNFIHSFYNLDPSAGWKTQIKEKYTVGVLANYTQTLIYKEHLPFTMYWTNNTIINSIITNISSGLAFQVNFINNALNPISNTSFFGTALQTKEEEWIKECYFGFKSFATYQIQDYTITGTLEVNPSSKKFHLEPWTWQNDLGFYWNLEHLNLSYHIIFKTREAQEMKTKTTKYGSVQCSYKF